MEKETKGDQLKMKYKCVKKGCYAYCVSEPANGFTPVRCLCGIGDDDATEWQRIDDCDKPVFPDWFDRICEENKTLAFDKDKECFVYVVKRDDVDTLVLCAMDDSGVYEVSMVDAVTKLWEARTTPLTPEQTKELIGEWLFTKEGNIHVVTGWQTDGTVVASSTSITVDELMNYTNRSGAEFCTYQYKNDSGEWV
jgi:hypothetical protein